LYLIMYNQQGLNQILSLWHAFRQNPDNPRFRHGLSKWGQLFRQLSDLHPWGPQDRLFETGLQEDWAQRVRAGEEKLCVEIELWFRKDVAARRRASTVVRSLVSRAGGRVVAEACIQEAAYHAILSELPIKQVEALLVPSETELVRCEQVMFFRPLGQAAAPMPDDFFFSLDVDTGLPTHSKEPPVVALLDGLPLENHHLLANRLIVDDPEGWAADYPSDQRFHGTAMASLILYGDQEAKGDVLKRPVYVRPILMPDVRTWRRPAERIPEAVLPADLIHRAVRRIFEGEGSEPPVAPTVRIINLSVGDPARQFDRYPSPWARLLDYLAWRYRVLFVVSAGNHPDDIELAVPRTSLPGLLRDRGLLEAETLKAIVLQTRNRRLLSPAEAINALTVGASHEDCSPGTPLGYLIDPFRSDTLPSPVSAQGPGFRRAVKPDVLFPGGRQTYLEKLGTNHARATLVAHDSSGPPGQKVASPGGTALNLSATRYTRGTSNAAALATRTLACALDVLYELRKEEPGGNRIPEGHVAVILKALAVHGACWTPGRDNIVNLTGQNDINMVARLIGYGVVRETDRILFCADHRATLLGLGDLSDGEAHRFLIPLPASLNGTSVWRRLVITLAWLTPINPFHRAYRRAALWFEPKADGCRDLLGLNRRFGPDWRRVRNGTVQHEVFEGRTACSFGSNSNLEVQVNCRAEAGELTESVPYALVVTLEVAPEVQLPIYEEIRAQIRPRIAVQAG
jgi:hypothetical protein